MKKVWSIGFAVLLAAGLGEISPAAEQGPMDRLESGIRASVAPTAAAAAPQRVYLGAYADDDAGRGVRLTSVRKGGPADQAGLQAQDLIVAAAGQNIHLLSDLTALLNTLKPGDRLALDFDRGNQPLRTEVVLGVPPGTAQAVPPTGPATGRTESIPPPPGDTRLPVPEGPALGGSNPLPVPAKSPQAQIEELRRRVDQLERKVQELEKALAESPKK
jgi:hypothetical protein